MSSDADCAFEHCHSHSCPGCGAKLVGGFNAHLRNGGCGEVMSIPQLRRLANHLFLATDAGLDSEVVVVRDLHETINTFAVLHPPKKEPAAMDVDTSEDQALANAFDAVHLGMSSGRY